MADEPAGRERREIWTSPTRSIRARMKALRQKRGWTADDLAAECEKAGMKSLNRSVLANIESGRRSYVTVDEASVLAYVLDVAPVHLQVPVEVDESVDAHRYQVAPDVFLPVPAAREWFRGRYCPPGRDPRVYWSEVPREEWQPPTLTDDEMVQQGAQRDMVNQLLPPGRRRPDKDGSDER